MIVKNITLTILFNVIWFLLFALYTYFIILCFNIKLLYIYSGKMCWLFTAFRSLGLSPVVWWLSNNIEETRSKGEVYHLQFAVEGIPIRFNNNNSITGVLVNRTSYDTREYRVDKKKGEAGAIGYFSSILSLLLVI